MIFSSLTYFVFFIVYFTLHKILPNSRQIFLIIIGSLIFYSWWKPNDLLVPVTLIIISYYGTILTSRISERFKKYALIFNLLFLYLPLLLFKYSDFIYSDILRPLLNLPERSFGFSIPLGISFITFTLTTYIVDVYKNKFPKNVSLQVFISYVLFFPQLIAGPILRPHELIPQLQKITKIKNNQIKFGISLFTLGLVKKIIFGDFIASTIVDPVFSNPGNNYEGLTNLISVYAFSMQIYCDFSGYTDMAEESTITSTTV